MPTGKRPDMGKEKVMSNLISQYIAGAEELSRKQAVIKRVSGTIFGKLHEHTIHLPIGSVVVEVDLGTAGTVQIVTGENNRNSYKRPVYYKFSMDTTGDWWQKNFSHHIPLPMVNTVYEKLEDIVRAADKAVPAAGLLIEFNAIAAFAPMPQSTAN